MNKILKENKAIQEILEKVKPYQDELTQKWVKKINEEGKIKLTDSDIELYEYKLVLDLTKALGNFLDKNDSLKDIKFDESYSSIELSCKVIRDEQIFNFSTEIIKAGGYNIQQLHLRYIVHTKLPRKKNVEYEKLNEQYKKMTSAQKIKEEISKIKQFVNITEIKLNEAKENSKLSDSEIEKLSREKEPESWKYIDTTWEEIVKRGADKNFDFDKNYYERETQRWKKSKIESWKIFNADVKHYETIIKTQQKYIEKLNKKLSELGLTEMSKGGIINNEFIYTIGGL